MGCMRAAIEKTGVNRNCCREERNVSIVRVGLAETKHFSEGYDAIFGKKKKKETTAVKKKASAKKAKAKMPKKAKSKK